MAVNTDMLVFFVNGKKVCLRNVEPETTLMAYLRRDLGLTGTKNGCDEGSCGACTVMVSAYNRDSGRIVHKALTSCMVPICTLHGLAVTTTEGIGSLATGLHPVQERIVKFHGTQCGFCTPGMVMSMYTLLRSNPNPTRKQVSDSLHGNICRCTGYRPIMDAFWTFSKETCCSPENGGCCQDTDLSCPQGNSAGCCRGQPAKLTDISSLSLYDPTQEPIFPPELQVEGLCENLVCFRGRRVTWYRPVTLSQALQIKSENPDAQIASGCTFLAQQLKTCVQEVIVIDISGLKELKSHEIKNGVLMLGAGLSMADLIDLSDHGDLAEVSLVQAVPKVLESWGSQLKNSATLGGHIMLRGARYDLMPLLVAGDCFALVASKDAERKIQLKEAFLRDSNPLKPCEILISVGVPCAQKFVQTFKVAKRKHQDLASLSAAFFLGISPSEKLKIDDAQITYGGNIPSLIVPVETTKFLAGRKVSEEMIGEAMLALQSELLPFEGKGLSKTQSLWAQGFLSKCLLELIAGNQQGDRVTTNEQPDIYKSCQIFEIDQEGTFSKLKAVGQPLTHSTGEEQATGEAVFIDDIPMTVGELYMYPVLSTQHHAKITGVDLSEALSMPGVHGYIDHKDVPGVNFVFAEYADEELLATDTVHHCGQIICGIVATDRDTAVSAAQCVKVTYEDLTPVILTIQEAIEAKSFLGLPWRVTRGNLEAGFAQSDEVLEGELSTKGQKHIYLETLGALSVPRERDQIEVYTGTQLCHTLQIAVAEVLGVPAHNVVVKVKRIGGGFGGKESRSLLPSMITALAARKFRRPVRCIFNRKDDTLINGGRHPSLARYKVGFTKEGKIIALQTMLYTNGGITKETSNSVIKLAVIRGESCYNIPNVLVEGRVCRTNHSSHASLRGFGCPQMLWIVENILTAVATHLSLQPHKVRELQLYKEGETTITNCFLENFKLPKCWEECKSLADFDKRSQLVKEFNSTNKQRKRGLAIQPMMFGIGIYDKFLNQAGALVHIYTDGSVLVTHGGCEMGQGLHTKIKQIASDTLGISFDKVLVSETCTNMVPNATATVASVSTELNGRAVHAACITLVERLRPFREADPQAGWEKWVSAAYFSRVSLSTTGFVSYGDFGFDFDTCKGPDCMYLTCGVGCSEVEVDCLTGEHKLVRTDIVMDVGRSINPAVDIGQIEGGFVQGYGYYMMEEVVHSPEGKLLTDSPLTYKIPLAADIPAQFNVALLKNNLNDKGIYSSKGIGEPPLLLALSVYLATHDAVKSARVERGLSEVFYLEHPSIPANVLKALN
ncbi:xanthine dehydrogenase/oxidase-like isoform X2 [Liolophura sinensis]|uniref:xanthine dehydrogenase/oxidase-like isoform X2 n=1 Tax=Liolophura sinensis TaxID=3198878 RepID=UPI0031588DA9